MVYTLAYYLQKLQSMPWQLPSTHDKYYHLKTITKTITQDNSKNWTINLEIKLLHMGGGMQLTLFRENFKVILKTCIVCIVPKVQQKQPLTLSLSF